MNEKAKTNSILGGCFDAFWTIALISALLFGFFVIQPIAVELIAPSFCQGRVDLNPPLGKKGNIICIDKKTGKEKNITHIRIFACCPGAVLLIFLLILWQITRFIFRKTENSRQ
jgi:hypothetical protein